MKNTDAISTLRNALYHLEAHCEALTYETLCIFDELQMLLDEPDSIEGTEWLDDIDRWHKAWVKLVTEQDVPWYCELRTDLELCTIANLLLHFTTSDIAEILFPNVGDSEAVRNNLYDIFKERNKSRF